MDQSCQHSRHVVHVHGMADIMPCVQGEIHELRSIFPLLLASSKDEARTRSLWFRVS